MDGGSDWYSNVLTDRVSLKRCERESGRPAPRKKCEQRIETKKDTTRRLDSIVNEFGTACLAQDTHTKAVLRFLRASPKFLPPNVRQRAARRKKEKHIIL